MFCVLVCSVQADPNSFCHPFVRHQLLGLSKRMEIYALVLPGLS